MALTVRSRKSGWHVVRRAKFQWLPWSGSSRKKVSLTRALPLIQSVDTDCRIGLILLAKVQMRLGENGNGDVIALVCFALLQSWQESTPRTTLICSLKSNFRQKHLLGESSALAVHWLTCGISLIIACLFCVLHSVEFSAAVPSWHCPLTAHCYIDCPYWDCSKWRLCTDLYSVRWMSTGSSGPVIQSGDHLPTPIRQAGKCSSTANSSFPLTLSAPVSPSVSAASLTFSTFFIRKWLLLKHFFIRSMEENHHINL